MKILKKNQLAILVIALMLVTAGYLNYTSNSDTMLTSNSNTVNDKLAAIGDATLVNSGELLEEQDKQTIANAIENANSQNTVGNTVNTESNQVENTVPTNAETKKNEKDEYFTNSKMEREKMYSQMLESYQKLLENTTISAEQKTVCQQEIAKINQTKNAIMIAENLISTKGFEDCVIFVNDASVNIIVKAENLETDQIAQIQNIIARELKVEVENIHISNK